MEEAAREEEEEEEWSCPICCSPWAAVALVQPCQHRFCLGCIARWVRISPSCPLCRGLTDTIKISVWGEENDLEHILLPIPLPTTRPPVAPDAAESPSSPARAPRGAEATALVGGIGATERAALLRAKWRLLAPALLWLRAALAALFGEQSCLATATEKLLLHSLRCCGPDLQAMGRQLEPVVGRHTHGLVRGLLRTVKLRCGEARALLRWGSEEEQEEEDLDLDEDFDMDDEEDFDLDEAENLDEDFDMEEEEEDEEDLGLDEAENLDEDFEMEDKEDDDDEYEEEEVDEEEDGGDEDDEEEDDDEEEEVTSSSADMAEEGSSVLENEGPISTEPEQPREEPVAGPCSRSPAAAGGHSEPVPAPLRCLWKRRAPSAPAAAPPCKRPASPRRH